MQYNFTSKNNKLFSTCSIAFFVISLVFLILFGKTQSFFILNNYHTSSLNLFFEKFTFLGDGIFALILFIFLLFFINRKMQAIAILLAFLMSGIAAQIIKKVVAAPRPKLFFQHGEYANFIDGVTLASYTSFPSGHTATAFAIATIIALSLKENKLKLLMLLIAILVAYSRIYLAQHFLGDVLAGAFIGYLSGHAANSIILKIKPFNKFVQS